MAAATKALVRALVLVSMTGCGSPEGANVDGGALEWPDARSSVPAGQAWERAAGPLPHRAEVVALADRLSIAAARRQDDRASLDQLERAAHLRERVWRLDQTATDAREASELYVRLVRAGRGTTRGCEADLRRAALLGETARNAGRAYREVYLARARQRRMLKQDGVDAGTIDPAARRCLAALDAAVGVSAHHRPIGAALDALRRDAARAEALLAPAGRLPAPPGPKLSPVVSGAVSPAAPKVSGDVLVVPDAALVGDRKAKVRKIEPYSWKAGGRVVLTLDHPARYEVGALTPNAAAQRGHRLYLDLLNTKAPRKIAAETKGDGLVERIRVGKRKGGTTRVVIDLGAAAHRRVFYLPNPFRVVVDLSTRRPPRTTKKTPSGRRAVRRVVLDPGHGGWDSGAIGPTGLAEKDVTLDVAHRAAPALASELGIETMLTRDNDAFVPLEQRTARANAYHADLFISIHCNATENGEAQGVEIFILDPSREMDSAAMHAVVRENVISRKKGAHRALDARALDQQLNTIAAGLRLGDVTARSRLLSQLLRKSTLASLSERYGGTHDHGIKTAGFFVLLGAEMPAVLYETAFISNPADEKRLATADFRQKLADAIVNAVRAYRDGVR